jgi:regulator of replication initiation timing
MSAENRSSLQARLRMSEALLTAMGESLSSVQRLLTETRAEIAAIRQEEEDSPLEEERRALRREVDQLREALASRAVIERAKGILMHTHAVSEAQSFELLNELSKKQQRKVRDVAAEVADAPHTPTGRTPGTGMPTAGDRNPTLASNGAAH